MKNLMFGLATLLAIALGACDNSHNADGLAGDSSENVEEVSTRIEDLAGKWELDAYDTHYVCTIKADGTGSVIKHNYYDADKANFTIAAADDGKSYAHSKESIADGWRYVFTTDPDLVVIERGDERFVMKRKK